MYSGEILLHAAFLKYIYQMVGRLPIREHGNERTRLLRLLSSFFPPFACLFVAIIPVLDLAFPGAIEYASLHLTHRLNALSTVSVWEQPRFSHS
jgi:hypothetical protein